MRTDDNYGSTIAYEPNSYDEWHDTPSRKEPPMKLQGGMFNYDERQYDDYYYTQPGKLWQLMSADDKKATCDNTAAQMEGVPLFIKQRHVRAYHFADKEYGQMLAKALGIDLEEALVAEDPAHPSWNKRVSVDKK